jgi:hypothetical protein
MAFFYGASLPSGGLFNDEALPDGRVFIEEA